MQNTYYRIHTGDSLKLILNFRVPAEPRTALVVATQSIADEMKCKLMRICSEY